jgi:glycosyltransferase involved in cell wall biosynthesis
MFNRRGNSVLKNDPIETAHFLDKWPKLINTTYKVSIEDSKELKIKAKQINKEALPIIIYYDNKKLFKDKIKTNNTYIAKFDGETNNSLQIQQVIVGFDKEHKQVFSVYNPLGSEMIVSFPESAVSYSVGLRLSGDGEASISAFSLTSHNIPTADSKKELYTRYPENDYLIITNVYPEKNNYYQNMFIHRRALSYKEKGINVEIYRLNTSPGSVASYSYEGIPVLISGEDELTRLLNAKPYKKILFHFVNERMYRAVRKSKAKYTPKLVWVHGYETTKWYRRWFNFYQSTKSLRSAINQAAGNQKQLDFMHHLYTTDDDDIKFIFVSNWYKEKIAEKDTNSIVKNFHVIHNVIDDELFDYVAKSVEQRKRILTIRPFVSRTYANDLTVKAILRLKDRPFFNELVFDIYGQGPLFDETVEPIRNLPNVHLHNYFLSQEEIAKQHKSHGIFLCPSRMDSQGVSLGEAMSSGLVPVTNDICAIPEFIDDTCGYLAPKEDDSGLADAIEHLYHNPHIFLEKSEEAAKRVRYQCGKSKMVQSELNEIIS